MAVFTSFCQSNRERRCWAPQRGVLLQRRAPPLGETFTGLWDVEGRLEAQPSRVVRNLLEQVAAILGGPHMRDAAFKATPRCLFLPITILKFFGCCQVWGFLAAK